MRARAMKHTPKNASFLFDRDKRFVLFALANDQVSWRGVGLLALVFFGSLVVAAVLMPFVYWAVEWWNPQAAHSLLTKGSNNLFDLIRWLPIVIAFPWLMKTCGLWSLRNLGLGQPRHFLGYWAAWFAVGTLLVGALAAGQLAANAVVIAPRESLSAVVILKWIAAALAVAVGVSFIEEIVFRGVILRMFYTAARLPWLALILSALFFAHVHFKAGGLAKFGTLDWKSGWVAAYWTLIGIIPHFDPERFLGLCLLGMILGALTLRTGSLWPAIGLHGGLVFGILTYNHLAHSVGSSQGFWGGTSLIDGWSASIALCLLLLAVVHADLPDMSRIGPAPPTYV